jgi:hypothetical protein
MLLALAVVGTLCGLAYLVLGLSAGDHLVSREYAASPSHRFLLTGVLWSLAPAQYSAPGKKHCARANVVLLIGAVSWLAWALLQ